jgi:hypothetical protein
VPPHTFTIPSNCDTSGFFSLKTHFFAQLFGEKGSKILTRAFEYGLINRHFVFSDSKRQSAYQSLVLLNPGKGA